MGTAKTDVLAVIAAAPKPASPTSRDGKLVQLPLPRFARSEAHFETRAPSKKEGV